MASRWASLVASRSREATGDTSPTGTLMPVSEKYPSSSAETSRFTRSPARSWRLSEGTPWAASSFTLMHVEPGNR